MIELGKKYMSWYAGGTGNAFRYQEYIALLNQSGTNAPVATVLKNGLGGITWGYVNVGEYSLSFDSIAVPANAIVIIGALSFVGQVVATPNSGGITGIESYNSANAKANGLLVNVPIIIQVPV